MKAFTRSLILRCIIEVTAGALSYAVGSMRLPEIFGMKSKDFLMNARLGIQLHERILLVEFRIQSLIWLN
ncbi:hypothetical protein ASE80_07770 [Pseudomonas sp. Leaf15]|nr:hypothetical protein ASE80_07770 [Pseudomonas sp. Leaf15]